MRPLPWRYNTRGFGHCHKM
ncbi:hypothetical protein QWA68_009193 [Fusarium oxysporum]|nr:hypothetical protein QWA68_009193 [Fusarium oxysporum]